MENFKKFNVTVCYDGAISYNITAENEEQAKEKAISLFKTEDESTIAKNVYNTDTEISVKKDESLQNLKHGISFSYINEDKEIVDACYEKIEDFIKAVDFNTSEIDFPKNKYIDLSVQLESKVFDVNLGSEESVNLNKQDIKNIRDLYEALADQYDPNKERHYEVELYRDGNFVTTRRIIASKKPTVEEVLELLKDDMNKLGCDTISNPYNLPLIDFESSLDNETPDEWVIYYKKHKK